MSLKTFSLSIVGLLSAVLLFGQSPNLITIFQLRTPLAPAVYVSVGGRLVPAVLDGLTLVTTSNPPVLRAIPQTPTPAVRRKYSVRIVPAVSGSTITVTLPSEAVIGSHSCRVNGNGATEPEDFTSSGRTLTFSAQYSWLTEAGTNVHCDYDLL